ncbi:MAG: helix-turn-helix domain-containing protein [Actinomycetes bacterium]
MTRQETAGAEAERSSTRRRILDLLGAADHPVDVAELATATGLHPNTLRGHLQLLVDLNQLDRQVESRATPGRPRVLYSIRQTEGTDDPYRQLAGELASGIASNDSSGAAHSAGRHWAKRLRAMAGLAADDRPSARTVTELAADGLEQLGFGTQTEPLGDRLYLTRCPFGALARENPSVCQVHAGLLSGLFDELGGQVQLEKLDIFVRPDLCIAHLRPAPPRGLPVAAPNPQETITHGR